MNEIIQSLEADATNGEEYFCYISEKKLKALKELSEREKHDKTNLQQRIDKAIEYIEKEYYKEHSTPLEHLCLKN